MYTIKNKFNISQIVNQNLKFKKIIPCNLKAMKIAILFPINCNEFNSLNQNTFCYV